jgi:V/A-type H+/Na+-transporting ATPase subunit I
MILRILRPATASWFELLTSREELGAALDCLAATGSVQLQSHSQSESKLALPDLRSSLVEFETLARRYGHYWPEAASSPPGPDHDLMEAPRAALARVREWAADADPLIAELEHVAQLREDTELLATLQQQADAAMPRLDRIANAGPVLAGRVYLLPEGGLPQSLPPAVLVHRVPRAEGEFLVAAGPMDDIAALDRSLTARKARTVNLPADLPSSPPEVAQHLAALSRELEQRAGTARKSLDDLAAHHELAQALGELALASWLVTHVPELPVTEHFAWITGWCADADDSRLKAALDARGLHYLLRLTPAPEGCVPPSVLRNPSWARPFEVFAGLMGVPGTRDADPSVIVALLAPLMFGFMFGDVVQGLAVATLGYVVRDRLPPLRLLMPGGIVAIVFGLAFGSVMAREDLLPALWVRPLEQPLLVLGTALAFGVVVLTVGLLLNALQYFWRDEALEWIAGEAGILVAYLGLVGTTFDARALWALPVGLAWAMAGPGLIAPRDRLGAVGRAAGEVAERMLQLGVNTVSFVRIGAFALAHAGLCTAVVGMAEAAGPGYWPVLLIGNVAIVALEGLVVGIQTTRLILFEFFIRFLTARGRPFEPLPSPVPNSNSIPWSKP